MLSLIEVKTKSQLREFIHLPLAVYADYPDWVPPLFADERKFHSPKHNEALASSSVKRWMLYREGKGVGRIMGIINHEYNAKHQSKTARFFQLDCIHNAEVSNHLLEAVETWARQAGMDKIIGPFGFSDKDPQGIKIDGFDHPSVLLTPSNPPYLQHLIEQRGYTKEIDCVSYEMQVTPQLPATYQRICSRIRQRGYLQLREFKKRSQLQPYIVPVLRMLNETYTGIYGFMPLSDSEIRKLAAQYLPILNPALVKLVCGPADEPLGFVVAMPGITDGLRKSKGKLFPLGFLHILHSLKYSRQLVLLLGAVKPAFRGLGVTALLAEALLAAAHQRGMTVIDTHLILENNHLMRAEAENLGGIIHKRFRVYQKSIG